MVLGQLTMQQEHIPGKMYILFFYMEEIIYKQGWKRVKLQHRNKNSMKLNQGIVNNNNQINLMERNSLK